ncbi:hypothetical protein BD408DRAFT_476486 [Parasitella parasitica]|nr:hypothetical protein BD408DRAFT_476486 [Parasitella parasitica]
MAQVLKDMIDSLHELALVGKLVDTKCTIVLRDSSAGYVQEADDICNVLLPILIVVYKSRVMIKDTHKLVKQKPVDIADDLDQYKTNLSSFTSEGCKKRKISGDSTEQ